MAVFCCGTPPDFLAVDAALSAHGARGVTMLLDEEGDWLAARSSALLATAAAAAAEMLPPVSCILFVGGVSLTTVTGPQPMALAESEPQDGGIPATMQLAEPGRGDGAPQSGTQYIRQLVTTAVQELLGTDGVDGTAPLMAAGAYGAPSCCWPCHRDPQTAK